MTLPSASLTLSPQQSLLSFLLLAHASYRFTTSTSLISFQIRVSKAGEKQLLEDAEKFKRELAERESDIKRKNDERNEKLQQELRDQRTANTEFLDEKRRNQQNTRNSEKKENEERCIFNREQLNQQRRDLDETIQKKKVEQRQQFQAEMTAVREGGDREVKIYEDARKTAQKDHEMKEKIVDENFQGQMAYLNFLGEMGRVTHLDSQICSINQKVADIKQKCFNLSDAVNAVKKEIKPELILHRVKKIRDEAESLRKSAQMAKKSLIQAANLERSEKNNLKKQLERLEDGGLEILCDKFQNPKTDIDKTLKEISKEVEAIENVCEEMNPSFHTHGKQFIEPSGFAQSSTSRQNALSYQ
ncbi:unnamed protein product [Caenorhabditis auriculariae]|uniref:Uncharacterized protein n=1 Tax=Caenorhabditis auriculariae TaxID=2777116 RepID=A0A8S1HBP6_9PELO|nr:unnamed protein product [Caenorhabditis auriculariae]